MFPSWLLTERERLFELIERDQIPHALLIHGPAGTGRRWLALAVIGRLLGFDVDDDAAVTAAGGLVDEETAHVHPDFSLVQPPPDKRAIPVDRIRELIGFLNLTSHQSGYKTALLNPAHAMNRHSSNSLLKTLEEPPGRSVIVLITDALSRLAPTIVSRCHRVRIAVPAPDEALDWLRHRIPGANWAAVLDLAGGAPIRALEYHEDGVPEQVATFERDVDALQRRRASPAGVAKRWAKTDGDLCLAWLYQRISADIAASLDAAGVRDDGKPQIRHLQNVAENLNIERAFAELRHIGELRQLHGSGLNADLQLSAILTRWYGQG